MMSGSLGDLMQSGSDGGMLDMDDGALSDAGSCLEGGEQSVSDECQLCHGSYQQPRVLECLHVFCESCLLSDLQRCVVSEGEEQTSEEEEVGKNKGEGEKKTKKRQQKDNTVVTCSICKHETKLSSAGNVAGLPLDYVLCNRMDAMAIASRTVVCTSCKSRETAVARCQDCSSFLCSNCVTAHKYMRCFDNHLVLTFEEMMGREEDKSGEENGSDGGKGDTGDEKGKEDEEGEGISGESEKQRRMAASIDIHRPVLCTTHTNEPVKHYCETCHVVICNECMVSGGHSGAVHRIKRLSEAEPQQRREMEEIANDADQKLHTLEETTGALQAALMDLEMQRDNAKSHISETYQSYRAILEKCRDDAFAALDELHSKEELRVMDAFQEVENCTSALETAKNFAHRLLKQGDAAEILILKQNVYNRLSNLLRTAPRPDTCADLRFETDTASFERVCRESFGRVFRAPCACPQDSGVGSSASSTNGAASVVQLVPTSSASGGSCVIVNTSGNGVTTHTSSAPQVANSLAASISAITTTASFPTAFQSGVAAPAAVSAPGKMSPFGANNGGNGGVTTTTTNLLNQFMAVNSANGGNINAATVASIAAATPTTNTAPTQSMMMDFNGLSPLVSTPALADTVVPPIDLSNLVGFNLQQLANVLDPSAVTGVGTPQPAVGTPGDLDDISGLGLHTGGDGQQQNLLNNLAALAKFGSVSFNPAGQVLLNGHVVHGLSLDGSTSGNATTTPTSLPMTATMTTTTATSQQQQPQLPPQQQQQQMHHLSGGSTKIIVGPGAGVTSTIGPSMNQAVATTNMQANRGAVPLQPPTALDLAGALFTLQQSGFGIPPSGPLSPHRGGSPHSLNDEQILALMRPASAANVMSSGSSSVVSQPDTLTNVGTFGVPSPVPSASGSVGTISASSSIRAMIPGKINTMQIRCKFGQLGTGEEPGKVQFSSPHGFCLGIDEEIIVADTNNHRIQIFDKSGEFKSQFGIAGKEEGQLWYPRKVAVMKSSGKYVVCDRGNERSRMQIFSSKGHFIKKIPIRYIDIVAGLAIMSDGKIVAVDSVSPTVFEISESGDLLKWFDCSEHMREPSDIAVYRQEFYICDFKGHCVVVFHEDGRFLRKIGYETLTNFPNGIDISDDGDVLVGDSHGNRFHVVVFSRDGQTVSEFECPYVKVSRCCGLKITSEGYVVTLAKNNHHVLVLNTLYIM